MIFRIRQSEERALSDKQPKAHAPQAKRERPDLEDGALHQMVLTSLDDDLARGDTSAATAWLRAHVQRHGGLYEPVETIEKAAGITPSHGPLLDYLEAKFSDIYGL